MRLGVNDDPVTHYRKMAKMPCFLRGRFRIEQPIKPTKPTPKGRF